MTNDDDWINASASEMAEHISLEPKLTDYAK